MTKTNLTAEHIRVSAHDAPTGQGGYGHYASCDFVLLAGNAYTLGGCLASSDQRRIATEYAAGKRTFRDVHNSAMEVQSFGSVNVEVVDAGGVHSRIKLIDENRADRDGGYADTTDRLVHFPAPPNHGRG